ncbi:MAG: hypothetical protein IPL65_06635 [Lewinellaceae bacterium]|nr:hypothetical protein [Lewinellaceae bacterium]
MNKEYFNINDLEPFFKNCFDVRVPKNIKPILLTINDLILLEERLEEYKKYEKIFQEGWFKRIKNSGGKGEKHHVSKKNMSTYQRLRRLRLMNTIKNIRN